MSEEVKEKRVTLDVAHLPAYAFGARSLMWWGTLGLIVIEGTMFAVLLGAYFYLRGRVQVWPPPLYGESLPPEWRWGVSNTLVLLLSVLPNIWYERAAKRAELQQVRRGLLLAIAFGVAFTALRFLEFGALNVRYDTNAYGSVVWTLLGFHTVHLITDLLDTTVLTVLLYTGPLEGKRFSDVSDNAFYWYFVVLVWLPIFATIYVAPRLL